MALKDKLQELLRPLNATALADLRDYIDTLIAEKEEAEEEAAVAATEGNAGPRGSSGGTRKDGERGWVEVKMIGKAGPYAYRRWYEGKQKKSKYVGKVKNG